MGQTADNRRMKRSYRGDVYVHGNTVRKVSPSQALPKQRQGETVKPQVSRKTRRNRERAMQLNFAYVAFLTAAAVASLFVCVNYLKLQAESATYRTKIAGLESQLSTLKAENDAEYEKALSSVDLEEIKDIAINELGMVYAEEGQIVTYNSQEGDYVRQYEDVPTE